MSDTFISVYLRQNRIHICIDTLRGIGKPSRICFLINQRKDKLVMVPYDKMDFKSHKVSYKGKGGIEINSIRLCRLLAELNDWDLECSYRIPGKVIVNQNVALFSLKQAQRLLFRV